MKKFILRLSIWAAPPLLIMLPITIYLQFFVFSGQTGDLEVLGTINLSGDNNEYRNLVCQKHRAAGDNVVNILKDTLSEDVTVVTIGDSFSNRDDSYSKFLAEELGERIGNIQMVDDCPIQTAATILNEGLLDDKLINVVIVETVERYLFRRVSRLDFTKSHYIAPKVEDVSPKDKASVDGDEMHFRSLIKRSLNWFLLLFKTSPVVKFKLSSNRFSIEPSNLYVYRDDLTAPLTIDDDQLNLVAERLEHLRSMYQERGIKLLFLVAADKYNMYQEDIIDNPYPAKTILDQLSMRLDSKFFVNSKSILRPYVDQGVKDIYWAEDTHWSLVGSGIVGRELARIIKVQESK